MQNELITLKDKTLKLKSKEAKTQQDNSYDLTMTVFLVFLSSMYAVAISGINSVIKAE